jgi:4-oxalocrotonate tautomerase family enzyme
MPVIHIYTAEGFLSAARKKLMIEKVTRAAVEAEGLPTTNRTYVLIHDVPDGGWGWQGEPVTQQQFASLLPTDPPVSSDIHTGLALPTTL